MVNGIFRVTAISWSCLLIEDTAPRKRVYLYAWITVASALAGYVVDRAGLIPAARGLYLFAFVSMTAMFLIRNRVAISNVIERNELTLRLSRRTTRRHIAAVSVPARTWDSCPQIFAHTVEAVAAVTAGRGLESKNRSTLMQTGC